MAASRARLVMLLIVCHSLAAGQSVDLTPLLPPPMPADREVRQALLTGAVDRAAALTQALPTAHRPLWQGILAIVRNEPMAAIRLLPRTGQPKVLGVAYYLAGQHLLFRQQMEEAIRLNPADIGAYYYLGRHYDADVGNAEEAAKWFRLALARKSDFARARYYLGSCLERLGSEAEARAEYTASADVPQSLAGLARLHLASGDIAAAVRYIEAARLADPRDAAAAKLAARVYTAADRAADARRALESAATLAPREAAIRYQLWRAYQGAGEAGKAAAALREYERLRSIYGAAP